MSTYALSTILISIPFAYYLGERGADLTARIVIVMIGAELLYRAWRHFTGASQ